MARRKAKSESGGGGGGVTELNGLTGAVNLVEGAGIDITIAGQDITIAAIGANVPSDTSLAVKVATTAVLPGSPTYDNGTAGVGATLTRGSNGTTGTIDGVTAANLMVGDYILVKNEANQITRGVYEVTQQGTASLPYILTRVAEADTTEELDDLVVTAALGTTNKGIPYGQQTNNPIIGTSNIVFTATGIYMRQQTSGTQAAGQVPYYTGTALTLSKGDTLFTRDSVTKDTLINREYTNSVSKDVLIGFRNVTDIGTGFPGTGLLWVDEDENSIFSGVIDGTLFGIDTGLLFQQAADLAGNESTVRMNKGGIGFQSLDTSGNESNITTSAIFNEWSVENAAGDISSVSTSATSSLLNYTPASGDVYEFQASASGARWTSGDYKYKLPTNFPSVGDVMVVESTSGGNRAILKFETPLAGSVSASGTSTTTFTVTIPVQATSTYKVAVVPTNALSAALFYVTNKTTASFDVVYLAGLTGTVEFDWIVQK